MFQCENRAGGKPVALKTLWEPAPGAGEAIFDEVKRLEQVQSDAVLKPTQYGFSDPGSQTRPYFVYERIPGALNGLVRIMRPVTSPTVRR